MSQFLDAAYPKSAAQFIGALRAGKQDGFTFYIGGDICLNAWPVDLVTEVRASYPGMAIHVPDLDSGDGAEAVALAHKYGLPAGYKIALDIEPGIFRSKPSPSVAGALADAWCAAVRAAGYSPVVYGTAATCAACADGADAIWLTVPGQPDANRVGLAPTFFPNRRAIQYASVVLNGVTCDVSNSQFPLTGLFGGHAASLGGFLPALTDEQQLDMYQKVTNIAAAIGTGPGETLALDLAAIERDFGIVPGTLVTPYDATKNPDFLGWSRDVSAKLDGLKGALNGLLKSVVPGSLTATEAAQLVAAADGISKTEAALKAAGVALGGA